MGTCWFDGRVSLILHKFNGARLCVDVSFIVATTSVGIGFVLLKVNGVSVCSFCVISINVSNVGIDIVSVCISCVSVNCVSINCVSVSFILF